MGCATSWGLGYEFDGGWCGCWVRFGRDGGVDDFVDLGDVEV